MRPSYVVGGDSGGGGAESPLLTSDHHHTTTHAFSPSLTITTVTTQPQPQLQRGVACVQVSEAGSFPLMQILDLGCQPPSNMLEVELHNELTPGVTCARWLVPNWASQLAEEGMAVTIDKGTGGAFFCFLFFVFCFLFFVFYFFGGGECICGTVWVGESVFESDGKGMRDF
jgi:hypothetical protein